MCWNVTRQAVNSCSINYTLLALEYGFQGTSRPKKLKVQVWQYAKRACCRGQKAESHVCKWHLKTTSYWKMTTRQNSKSAMSAMFLDSSDCDYVSGLWFDNSHYNHTQQLSSTLKGNVFILFNFFLKIYGIKVQFKPGSNRLVPSFDYFAELNVLSAAMLCWSSWLQIHYFAANGMLNFSAA